MSAVTADPSPIDQDFVHDGPPPTWLRDRILQSLAEIESGAAVDADDYQRLLNERLLRDETAGKRR